MMLKQSLLNDCFIGECLLSKTGPDQKSDASVGGIKKVHLLKAIMYHLLYNILRPIYLTMDNLQLVNMLLINASVLSSEC